MTASQSSVPGLLLSLYMLCSKLVCSYWIKIALRWGWDTISSLYLSPGLQNIHGLVQPPTTISLLVKSHRYIKPTQNRYHCFSLLYSSHQPAFPALPLRTASSSLMSPAGNLGVSGDLSHFLIYHIIIHTAYCFSPPKYLSYLSLLLISPCVNLIHFDSGTLSSLIAFNHAVKSVIYHAANAPFPSYM